MSKTRYAFKVAMFGKDADPQEIGEYLETLIDENNEYVDYDGVVAAARKNGSPIKPFFTWDENAAADKWRKKEAKNLVTQLHTADSKGEATRTRAFCYVHSSEHGGKKVIMTTRTAMTRPDLREQVVEQAVRSLQRSLNYWSHAYGGNASLRLLAKDVDRLRKRAEKELLLTTA